MYEDNCFLTLTFSPEELDKRPNPWSLDVRDFQTFMKRARKKHGKMRFFHCGEYGEKNKRPHYHVLIFGFDFPDKKLHKMSNGLPLYVSESLNELWPYGHAYIGTVTFESCAYVARYIFKKINGDMAESHYKEWITPEGEVTEVVPEYATMSRRPGIGATWLEKWFDDVYPNDYVVVNGKKLKPPRFYDNLLKEKNIFMWEAVKSEREENAPETIEYYDENMDRLFVQEQVKIRQLQKLIRDL